MLSLCYQTSILCPPTYLLFIKLKCLLDVGDLWGANGQSLDLMGRQSAEVTDRFDVSGSNELPEAPRPDRDNLKNLFSLRFFC